MCSQLRVHFHSNQTYFHVAGFERGLVLKESPKQTRKSPFFFFHEKQMFILMQSIFIVSFTEHDRHENLY